MRGMRPSPRDDASPPGAHLRMGRAAPRCRRPTAVFEVWFAKMPGAWLPPSKASRLSQPLNTPAGHAHHPILIIYFIKIE
jgi:hypothetical protein